MTAGAAVLAGLTVTLACAAAAAAGPRDMIRLTVPHPAPRTIPAGKPKVYSVAVNGFAAGKTYAYVFVDYAPCSPSFAVEAVRAKGEVIKYKVRRGFTRISRWYSSLAGTDHACGYLVSIKTGRGLAAASAAFTVR